MSKMKELHYNMQQILKDYKEGMSRDLALLSLWQLGLNSGDASDFLRRGHYLRPDKDNKKGPKLGPSSCNIDVV